MPLLAVLESLDDVDEALKGLYVQKKFRLKSKFASDGKEIPGDEVDRFVLELGEPDEHPHVITIVNALERQKRANAKQKTEFETLRERFNGLPDDFTVDQYETLKAAAEAHENAPAGETEEQKRERLAKGEAAIKVVEQKLERITKQKDGEIQKLNERITALNNYINKLLVDEGLARALSEAGVKPNMLRAAKAMLRENCKVVGEGDDRQAVYETSDIGEVPITKFVKDWASSDDGKDFVEKPKGGGGQGGDQDRNRDTDGKNPFAKKVEEGHNLTRQGQIRQQDPAKAKRMMKEAGWTPDEIRAYFPNEAAA